jgi:glycine/D-amino acid oxidase-like deaminating enzyme
LTTSLLELAKSNGAQFIQAGATSLSLENKRVTQVHAKRGHGSPLSLPCDNLIITTGPWTGILTNKLLKNTIPITSYAGHSIIIRPSTQTTPDCLFMTLNTSNSSYNPEIFPRASGEIYICGINQDLPLPSTPTEATPRGPDIQKLKEIATALFPSYTIEKEQLCFRPMTAHGDPFIGGVPEYEGIWVGAGHTFWGITLGPGTGKILAEMVRGEELSADVSDLALSI